jgi:two-component system, sporulation sensor kinase A
MIPQQTDFLSMYEFVFSESCIGLVVIDRENKKIIKVNQAFCDILGSPEHVFIGCSVESFINASSEQFLSSYPIGEDGSREIRFTAPSGKIISARMKLHLYNPSYAVAVFERIESLPDNSAYRGMLNKQQAMTFTYKKVNDKFIHTFADGALLYRLGFYPEMVIGKELKDILGEDIAKEKEQYYLRAWAGEEHVQYEGQHGDITYLAQLKPIIENGSTVQVIATCLEITERIRMEEAIRQAENKYRTLVEEMIIGICIIQDEVITYINPYLSRMLGFPAEQFIGKRPFDFIVPEERLVMQEGIERIMKNAPCSPILVKGVAASGRLLDLEIYGVVTSMNDRPAILGMVMDVTEKRLTEEMLQKSEKLSVIGQLAAGIAHEIRNPLTSLKGFVQLIRRNDPSNHYYDIMLSELERINLIVNELLIVAKPQASSYRSNEIVSIVNDVVVLLESQAMMNNVTIEFHRPVESIYVECEANQIKQMFINIIKNAIESMTRGGTLVIDINGSLGDKVVVRVQDEGCGIPEERLPRLGEPFYSTKDKGTGLGLMMCYKIIQEHGGHLRIDSEVGKGTTVEVALYMHMANPAAG